MKLVALLLMLLLLLAGAVHAAGGKLKAGVFEPPRAAPDFVLVGSDGGELKLSHHRGKVVLLAFGFTHCPYVCPTTLATLSKARRKLGTAAKDVQVVYVTVDPERDTAERMRTYLASFEPAIIGATGTPEQLAGVRQAYGVSAVKLKTGSGPSDYAVDHSSSIYLIDREGNLRALMPYGRGADDFANDLAILLGK